MTEPILYRKRLIPPECFPLVDDVIITYNDEYVITTWNAIHPKKDLHHGRSIYFLKDGIKLSKFCHEDDSLMQWYCDIIDYEYDEATHILTVIDLLADVVIKNDGIIRVVDLDELVEAHDKNLITTEQLKDSLLKLNKLLSKIYAGEFSSLTKYLDF